LCWLFQLVRRSARCVLWCLTAAPVEAEAEEEVRIWPLEAEVNFFPFLFLFLLFFFFPLFSFFPHCRTEVRRRVLEMQQFIVFAGLIVLGRML
jgi:hypothetical protein